VAIMVVLPVAAQENRDGPQPPPRFPELSNLEAWIQLPEAVEGAGEELPAWARVLAGSLPTTTSKMLELDWLQRQQSPLEPKLRGKLRWTVAKANRCDYTRAYAEADLKRAGLVPQEIAALGTDSAGAEAKERAAIEFARKLTLAGDTVTDEEVAALTELYGEQQLVAIVLLAAHGNFQDRLFLSLGVRLAPSEPLAPVKIRFARGLTGQATNVPKRERPTQTPQTPGEEKISDARWLALDVPALQEKMQAQQQRQGRIRVPTWEEVSRDAPKEIRKRPPVKIRWSLVCRGYQPALADGWGACMGTFGEEAQQDRVFEESLFWVITREINCFY
jgi:alkylhydroperoxidase family enzyme